MIALVPEFGAMPPDQFAGKVQSPLPPIHVTVWARASGGKNTARESPAINVKQRNNRRAREYATGKHNGVLAAPLSMMRLQQLC
jgi:hypothetical protein